MFGIGRFAAAVLILLQLKKNQLSNCWATSLKSARCRKKKMGRWTFWWGKAPGVPEFSALEKFWQKTLRRWSNVTCVQERDTLTCLERKYNERNRWALLIFVFLAYKIQQFPGFFWGGGGALKDYQAILNNPIMVELGHLERFAAIRSN